MKTFVQMTLAIVALTGAAQAAMTTVDFNTPGDLNAYFTSNVSSSAAVKQTTSGGLSGGGAVDLKSGGGNQLWFWQNPYTAPATGDSLVESLYFKYDQQRSNCSIKLGFSTQANDPGNGVAMPTAGSWAYVGIISYANGYNGATYNTLSRECYDSAHDLSGLTNAGTFTNGSWYHLADALTRTGTNTYKINWALYGASADGTLNASAVASGEYDFTMAGFSTSSTLYSYLGLENATSSNAFSTLDNFANTSPVVSPEPATISLLGLGMLTLIRRRRK